MGACSNESISKDRSRAYCARSSVHLAMASTVEAQTAEEAKSLSKAESCDRKPVIDMQMPASRLTEISTSSTFDAWPWCSKNETRLHASLT